jgi:hypothetical protein
MSAPGQSRHFSRRPTTSGLPLETDVVRVGRHVSKVPNAEMSDLPRRVRCSPNISHSIIAHCAKSENSHNLTLKEALSSIGGGRMQRYVTLAEGSKHNRRSVADAIELLAAHADFRANSLATIRTLQLPVSARKPLFQLCVTFENLSSNVTSLVWLPTSSCFKAQALGPRRTDKFATADLNGATVDFTGNVSLPTGAQLRAVEVVPATLPYELSDLEWRILKCTVRYMKIEDVVVRTFGEELDVDVQATLPVIRRIDFQRLKGFEVPPLKVLQHFIIENVKDL